MIQYGNGVEAIPPGEYIKDHLNYLGLIHKENYVATRLEISLNDYRDLLEGGYPVTPDLAERLADIVGVDKGYWLALEKCYQDDLELIRKQNKGL